MKSVNAIGDRLLAMFVPRATASAVCAYPNTRFCYCINYIRYAKDCCNNFCGSCYRQGGC